MYDSVEQLRFGNAEDGAASLQVTLKHVSHYWMFYEAALKPWVHYVPVGQYDARDILPVRSNVPPWTACPARTFSRGHVLTPLSRLRQRHHRVRCQGARKPVVAAGICMPCVFVPAEGCFAVWLGQRRA